MGDVPGSPRLAAGERLSAIDILRGLVIILMVLDHTRDAFHASGYAYNPLDADRSYGILYVTRWITHFCAPTFVFLAGVSTWLQRVKGKDRGTLSRFLLTRGLWLVLLEMTVISFGWAFTLPYFLFLQVIWAIGWSMVALAALIWLPRPAVLAIGIAIVVGHNLFDGIDPARFGSFAWLWAVLQTGAILPPDGPPVALIAYPILAWIGVMALGYGMGPIFLSPMRDRTLRLIGLGMIAAFLLLRLSHGYGDPRAWSMQPELGKTLMLFFNVEKYPPSLHYVCATLGPVLLLFPTIGRWQGRAADMVRVYGSVPLFAYLAHVYLLHLLNLAVLIVTGRPTAGSFDLIRTAFLQPAKLAGTSFPLIGTYAAWATLIVLLYPLCRRWSTLKRIRRDWWLSYL